MRWAVGQRRRHSSQDRDRGWGFRAGGRLWPQHRGVGAGRMTPTCPGDSPARGPGPAIHITPILVEPHRWPRPGPASGSSVLVLSCPSPTSLSRTCSQRSEDTWVVCLFVYSFNKNWILDQDIKSWGCDKIQDKQPRPCKIFWPRVAFWAWGVRKSCCPGGEERFITKCESDLLLI